MPDWIFRRGESMIQDGIFMSTQSEAACSTKHRGIRRYRSLAMVVMRAIRLTSVLRISAGYFSGSLSSSSLASLRTSVAALKLCSSGFEDVTSTPRYWQIFCCISSTVVSSCSASMPT